MPCSSFLSQNLPSVSFSSERSSAFDVRHRRRERFVRPMSSSSISDAETSSTTNTNTNKNTKRVVVITGGNAGLGCISAQEIARLSMNADDENGGKEKEFSYSVVIACRSIERGQKAMRDVGLFLDDEEGKEGETNPSVDVMECDLSSFKSTRAFAEKFKSKYDRLDVLMNNAGVMALPEKTLTEDANELQMQTNHLSHFALTRELLPLMLETEKRYPERKPRVVNVASIAHEWGFVDFFNLNSEGVFGYPGWGWITYGRTKMANVLFTYELQRKLRKIGSKIQAYCVHPGVVDTELQRNLPIDWYVNLREAGRLINPPEGARGQIFVATSEALENDEGGKYSSELSNEGKPGEHAFRSSNAFSLDQENWARLWKDSERITGAKYDDVFHPRDSV